MSDMGYPKVELSIDTLRENIDQVDALIVSLIKKVIDSVGGLVVNNQKTFLNKESNSLNLSIREYGNIIDSFEYSEDILSMINTTKVRILDSLSSIFPMLTFNENMRHFISTLYYYRFCCSVGISAIKDRGLEEAFQNARWEKVIDNIRLNCVLNTFNIEEILNFIAFYDKTIHPELCNLQNTVRELNNK